MDSDYSGAGSDYSDDESEYAGYYYASLKSSDAKGKILCPCGCGKTRTIRTTFRHLKILRARQAAAENEDFDGATGNSGAGATSEINPVDTGNASDVEMREEGNDEDLPMHYDPDEEEDPLASPSGSWYDVPTPPPSPPPFSLSEDENLSEDDNEYADINAEDYREYDRWFAEDREAELDEFVAETLTEKELDSIKLMAIRQFGHLSIRNYERIRYSFRDKVFLLTMQELGTRLASLSGIKAQDYDCCINICHAFTGDFAEERVCSICSEQRFDELGHSRQTYQYIPTIGRFLSMFNNPAFVEKLAYRHNYPQHEGRLDDFFDSQLYKNLCQQNIVIDGEDIGVKYFSGKYNIATTLLADGVQIYKQETATCWPVMLQILNLPPRDRAQMRNVMPLCVIPGPNQPKDFNSFLEPFVLESLELARGVEAYNSRTGRKFIFRHHPVLVGGDMQAIKHLKEMKGVGGKLPCRGCEGAGVYHYQKRTYYIPLAEPLDPDAPARTTDSYDPLDLPNRTEARMKRQLEKMENSRNPREDNELGKKYGIAGLTILDRIPSLQRPTSYPHEFLHLFLLNHIPDLITLWIGGHPSIPDAGCENYLISKSDWAAIGRETEAATNLLPRYFVRPLPNIQTHWRVFCGESWAFWVLYVGPIVLRNRLPKKYLKHFLELVAIVRCLIQYENTTDRIEQLREEIAGYIERYEEYYYQYNYDRLCVCKLTVHALLHVADDVLRCGPVWVFWSYLTERYCREIIACARQRVVPFATVMKFVLQMAQLSAICMRFAEVRKALLFGKSDAPVDVSKMEQVYADYPDTILRRPRLPGFFMQLNVRRRIAAFMRTNVCFERSHYEWMQYLPKRCERWGKLRISDGGDCIRAACARNPHSAYGKRDNSFVKFTFDEDKNARTAGDVEMIVGTGYGRLDYILAITLPPNPDFGIQSPQLHILAHVTEAKDAVGDASAELVSYTDFGRSFVLDITSVKCAVGRVHTEGVRPSGEWVIVDRSDILCQTAFHQEGHEFEEDDQL